MYQHLIFVLLSPEGHCYGRICWCMCTQVFNMKRNDIVNCCTEKGLMITKGIKSVHTRMATKGIIKIRKYQNGYQRGYQKP